MSQHVVLLLGDRDARERFIRRLDPRDEFSVIRIPATAADIGTMVAAACSAPGNHLVSCSSLAESTSLIGELRERSDGMPATIITAIEASSLVDRLHDSRYERVAEREVVARSHLFAAQIEFADLLVIDGIARLGDDERGATLALLGALNPTAHVVIAPGHRSTHRLVRTVIATPHAERPGWSRVLSGTADPHLTHPRVTTFRYENLRPFHTGRLLELIEDDLESESFGRVIRSGGFCRFSTRPERSAFWNQVGAVIAFDPLPADEVVAEIAAIGQDIAFTGFDLDAAGLSTALDAAALTDDEWRQGADAWRSGADDLPLWVHDEH